MRKDDFGLGWCCQGRALCFRGHRVWLHEILNSELDDVSSLRKPDLLLLICWIVHDNVVALNTPGEPTTKRDDYNNAGLASTALPPQPTPEFCSRRAKIPQISLFSLNLRNRQNAS